MRTTADLRECLEAIDVCYFEGQLDALGVDVRWMRARDKTTRVGKYWHDRKVIEIARVLAADLVPDYYVRFVIYHEALHAILGPEHDGHSQIFRLLEGRFLQIVDVFGWEEKFSTKAWPPTPKGLR